VDGDGPRGPQPLEWDDTTDAPDAIDAANAIDDVDIVDLEHLERIEGVGERRGRSVASQHVVSGRRGPSPRVLAGVVATLVAVGGVLVWGGGGDDPASPGRDDGDGAAPPSAGATGEELEVVNADDASATYAEAAARLGRAHTFAFSGTVRSGGPSLVRPGPWVAHEVRVEGAVQLPLSITTEVAVGPDGTAAETVTSGPVAWTRRADGVDQLAAAPWAADRPPELTMDRTRSGLGPPPSRLGMALVLDAIVAAGDRRDAAPDEAGRRVLRATVPEPRGTRTGNEYLADVVGGAEVAIALDDDGDIARIEITTPPGRPVSEIALDVERLGDPGVIAPSDLVEPIAATLPSGALAEVGLGSLALRGLPSTWVPTDASVYRPDLSHVGTGRPTCDQPVLALDYANLTGVLDGHLHLSVRRDPCPVDGVPRDVTNTYPGELMAGRFAGSIDPSSPEEVFGEVSDGTTVVEFITDLPPPDAAAAIASLVPAGAGAGVGPMAAPVGRSGVCQVRWCR
jgi:hypothetical protein